MDKEIKILDLGEAATLEALGFELLRLEQTHKPRQRAFVFPATIEKGILGSETKTTIDALDIATRYSNHDLQLDARKLYESIRSLKSKLHADLEAVAT